MYEQVEEQVAKDFTTFSRFLVYQFLLRFLSVRMTSSFFHINGEFIKTDILDVSGLATK